MADAANVTRGAIYRSTSRTRLNCLMRRGCNNSLHWG
ncbi:hypothetical protein DMI62_10780 [Escherichia coli]|nr:hypothetical protein [Escherichia coli]